MSDIENEYKDASKLSTWVKYLLLAQILVAVISISSNFLEFQLLSDFQDNVYTSEEESVADGIANDERQMLVANIYLLVFIVSGILILRWIHRANYNARQLGAKYMEFTPGWSIGYYFIPIMLLWKPYLAMTEIWRASHKPQDWLAADVGSVLRVWWFLWLASNMLGQAVLRMSLRAVEIQDFININILNLLTDVLAIPLALVTLSIVNSIQKAQTLAYESDGE